MCPTVPDVPRIFAVVSKGQFTPDELDALEERAAIIHEAHTIVTGDDGKPLPAPIFTITHQQAEHMALAETETETET